MSGRQSADPLDGRRRISAAPGGSFLQLPATVRNKKAVINPNNIDDDDCLEWTFLIAEANPQPPHHPERIPWYAAKKGKNSLNVSQIPNSKTCLIKSSMYLAGTGA